MAPNSAGRPSLFCLLFFIAIFCSLSVLVSSKYSAVYSKMSSKYSLNKYAHYQGQKPSKEQWISGDRTRLLEWLIARPKSGQKYSTQNGLNGFFNNPFQPELGALGTLLRLIN